MIVLCFCFKCFYYSHRKSSTKKMLLEILENSWENTCWSLFSNKVATLLKRDSEIGSFPVIIAKFL